MIRSHTPSQRSSSPGMSTLASARFRLAMSRQEEEADEEDREGGDEDREEASPRRPSTAEIASGTETATSSAPDWTFSAAPESPSHDELVRLAQLLDHRRQAPWRKSRTLTRPSARAAGARAASTASAAPEHGDRRRKPARQPRLRHHGAGPGTRRRARGRCRRRRAGTCSPIATNAATTPNAATTSRTVRIGKTSATRCGSRGSSTEG